MPGKLSGSGKIFSFEESCGDNHGRGFTQVIVEGAAKEVLEEVEDRRKSLCWENLQIIEDVQGIGEE